MNEAAQLRLLMRDALARGRYWERISDLNFARGLPERGAYAAEMAMKHYRRHIELMMGNSAAEVGHGRAP
jgi:hypothetical protein